MNNGIKQLSEELQTALNKNGITELSEVQQQCIPHACKGEDILAHAPTGSGKTYAYLLPILERIERQGKGKHYSQAIILTPTRELSMQIAENIRHLLANIEGIRTTVLTGGSDMNAQVRAFSKGADIIIGTPSRICDHLRRHTIKPKMCHITVLDEADVMLSMGFAQDVQTIIDALPEHQTMLFSATYNKSVEAMAQKLLHQPFTCEVQKDPLLVQKTVYCCCTIAEKQKLDLLKHLLTQLQGQILIFCNTRRTTDFVCNFLHEHKWDAETIHSEMDPKERKEIMKNYREHKLQILCATDVASRGIDIPAVNTVICYDLPDALEDLTHCFGRTSRAGNTGTAYLFLRPEQNEKLPAIQMQFPTMKMMQREYH